VRRDPGALDGGVFDVAVLGGGVLGAAVAREAARRGLAVALLEKDDFGCEASANNLRILHGGVRSLSRGRILDGRASRGQLVEWCRIAPHLVDSLAVLAPTGSRALPRIASVFSNVALTPGHAAVPPRARPVDRRELAAVWPGGASDPDLPAAALEFEDGLAYNAERLVLTLVKEAAAAGATVLNHVEATGGTRREDRIERLSFRDVPDGTAGAFEARLVVNVTGASVAEVAGRLGVRVSPPGLSFSLNLLVGPRGLDRAIGVGKERRVFFVPWREAMAIGTAHHPVCALPDLDEAVEGFLAEANRAWPGDPIALDEIRHVQTGWVLADSSSGAPARVSERSWMATGRTTGCANLVSAASHKLTTAPAFARRVLDVGLRDAGLSGETAGAGARRHPGSGEGAADPDGWARTASALETRLADRAPRDVVAHTIRMYGTEADRVLAADVEGRDDRIVVGAPVVRAHFTYAVVHEMAITEDDILERRSELGPRGLVDDAARAAARTALEMRRGASGRSPEH